MPEFFFHLSIEIVFESESQDIATTFSWPTGLQALLPFREHSILDSSFKQSGTSRKGTGRLLNDYQPAPSLLRPTTPNDKRLDHIFIESTNTASTDRGDIRPSRMNAHDHLGDIIGFTANTTQTRGRYEPLDQQVSESVWGVVHLYRDADETPGLYGDSLLSKPSNPWYSRTARDDHGKFHPPAADQDCTTLCILAVPSYMAPSDFLGFLGEETREQVSHFRMIRTARANRYMVLVKFRDGRKARSWQKAWNGKVFNSMEVCTLFPSLTDTSPTSSRSTNTNA
jgi:BRCA1-associated protein